MILGFISGFSGFGLWVLVQTSNPAQDSVQSFETKTKCTKVQEKKKNAKDWLCVKSDPN